MCVCAKCDQFLPARFYFESKRPENFVRIAKFPYAAFGTLFAFHCPLCFTRNNDLERKSSRFAVIVRSSVADKQLAQSIQPAWRIAKRSARKRSRPYVAECNDHGSNPMQGTLFVLHFYCLRLARLTFNKS